MLNNKEMLSRKTEYMVAGAIGLYIVFFTRPAPMFVSQFLSSMVAQIAGLAAVIYVGATQSLVVAVVLAVALVLSAPSREHLASGPSDKSALNAVSAAKKEAESPMKKDGKDATKPMKPAPAAAPPAPATAAKDKKETFENDIMEKDMNMGTDSIAAAGQDAAQPAEKKGSESFSLMNAAPF